MTFTDLFADLYTSLTFANVHAEAPPVEEEEKSEDEEGEEKSEGGEGSEAGEEEEKEEEGGEDGGEDGGEQEEQEEEAEEEEEEEEVEDIKPKLEEECARTAKCAPLKHHFDACADRVTAQQEEDYQGPKEDCVEEFFHLSHCAAQCAAPKLFAALK